MGLRRVKRQLQILLGGVNSFCFKHSKRQKSDYYTSVTSPDFLVWPVRFDQKFACHLKTPLCVTHTMTHVWMTCVIVQSSPFPRVFSLSLCSHRTHPFSQCSLPSLSVPEWPSLILSSSHLGGGLLTRPSGPLITTVSLSFATTFGIWKPKTQHSDEHHHWEYCWRCFWTPCPGWSSGSCLPRPDAAEWAVWPFVGALRTEEGHLLAKSQDLSQVTSL